MQALDTLAGIGKASRYLAGALMAGLIGSSPRAATSIDAGQMLYTTNCVGCHGTPPNGLKIDNLVAANRPELIRRQIQTNPAMQFLTALTDADLANIATFLANPTSSDADCIFGWGETILPALLTPRTLSATNDLVDYRFYPPAVYVGVAKSPKGTSRHLYYLDQKTASTVVDLGDISVYLPSALAAGCP